MDVHKKTEWTLVLSDNEMQLVQIALIELRRKNETTALDADTHPATKAAALFNADEYSKLIYEIKRAAI